MTSRTWSKRRIRGFVAVFLAVPTAAVRLGRKMNCFLDNPSLIYLMWINNLVISFGKIWI